MEANYSEFFEFLPRFSANSEAESIFEVTGELDGFFEDDFDMHNSKVFCPEMLFSRPSRGEDGHKAWTKISYRPYRASKGIS